MALQPGFVLHGRYRIEGQLGKGGMGAVYLAFDQTLQIKVAVKENLSPSPEAERQFKREASILATLRHPNLPRVTDFFVLEDRQYLVMDYIEGEDLHTRAVRQPPTVEEVLAWAEEVAQALHYLHSRNPPIIHRDIKPANIKVQPDGTVVLVDFGIAKVYDQQQTTTGARGLTPGFSPPEQYGAGRTDPRSDQYSLAATIYALLTGRPPADSIERMLGNLEFKPARALNPAIPPHVDEALTRALSINKEGRFPDIPTFMAALRGEIAAPTVRAAEPQAPRARRWLLPALGGAGLLGLLLAGAGVLLALGGGLPGFGTPPTVTANVPAVAGQPASPTATFTATASPSPSPTATALPTATPSPVPPTATAPVALLGGGGRLAFVSDREDGRTLQIWTMLPDGSDLRQLTFGPGDKTQPRWSPDGRRLAFVAHGGQDRFGNDLGLDIWVINADGTGLRNLTHHPGNDTDPAWSPDGRNLAFTSDRVNQSRLVFYMPTDCLEAPEEDACWQVEPTRLSCTSEFCAVESSPTWSPEGNRLAVTASINNAPGRIYLRTLEPGDPVRLDPADRLIGAESLDWSPDGAFLAFTWNIAAGRREIYVVEVDQRPLSPVQLTNSLGNKEPAYSPDGQWIAFTSTRDQNPEVYIMRASGANQTNLTNAPSSRDMQPDWQPLPAP